MTRERAGTRTVWGRKSDGTQGAVARMKGRVWQGQRPLQGQQRMDAERRGRPQPSILSALRFVPTGSTAPPPSWEQGPQDRRHQHPVTPVFRRPGEGHGALYDFLVSCVFRRFRSLRSMGLKAVRTVQAALACTPPALIWESLDLDVLGQGAGGRRPSRPSHPLTL